MNAALLGTQLRLVAGLAALVAGLLAAFLIADLLHTTPGPTPSAAANALSETPQSTAATQTGAPPRASGRIATPSAPGFPSPPPGAVVFSVEYGANALALALAPKASRLLLQLSVVDAQGAGRRGLTVSFQVVTRSGRRTHASATVCGRGCYSAVVGAAAPRSVKVVVVGASAQRRAFTFPLAATWPPPDAARLVARAETVWRGLHTLVSHERLASSPTNAIRTRYRMVAPDRFSYEIAGGSAAIIVGGKRWDRTSAKAGWQASTQQPPLRQPVPFWAAVANARIVGSERIRGRAAWRVTFFDPRTPAWFEVAIDKQTLRTLDLRMVATAHFMHDVYGPFNRPLEIAPPARSGGKR